MTDLLTVINLTKRFPIHTSTGALTSRTDYVRAVDGVDLTLRAGETLGLVGESGCGKSTLGRCILRLIEPTGGSIVFDERDFLALRSGDLRRARREAQIVFQDPLASLDPRMTVGRIIAEPLIVHGIVPRAEVNAEVRRLLELVGLPLDSISRYPHEFSGGQRQRVGIARAISLRPKLIVADEPVSADLHRPRPRRRTPGKRPHRRDVPRQDRRNRTVRNDL
jgi:ABC-type glutathione transport system ATPase component